MYNERVSKEKEGGTDNNPHVDSNLVADYIKNNPEMTELELSECDNLTVVPKTLGALEKLTTIRFTGCDEIFGDGERVRGAKLIDVIARCAILTLLASFANSLLARICEGIETGSF